MSRDRRSGLATILTIVGLLTFVEAQAQPLRETAGPGATTKIPQPIPASEPTPELEAPVNLPETTNPTVTVESEVKAGNVASASSGVPPKTPMFPAYRPLFLPAAAKLTLVEKAYLDVYSILRDDNPCSRFYGGPGAIEALNELTSRLKPRFLDRTVGLRMKGNVSYSTNYLTGFTYRVFAKAELNSNGPFYKTNIFPLDSGVPKVGEYSPNTREARITILLHELGHMVQTADKLWVLPNDGEDAGISGQNTRRVIEVCRDQIKSRERISFEQALASAQTVTELKPAQLATTNNRATAADENMAESSAVVLRQIGRHRDARCGPCYPEIQIPQDY
jgi:hypothetical protein